MMRFVTRKILLPLAALAAVALSSGSASGANDPPAVFVEDGKVIEQSREERGQVGSECIVAWGICDYYRTVTGSYGNGHLEIEIESRTDVTFNGLPAVPGGAPTQPGTINLVDATQIKVDFNPETTDT